MSGHIVSPQSSARRPPISTVLSLRTRVARAPVLSLRIPRSARARAARAARRWPLRFTELASPIGVFVKKPKSLRSNPLAPPTRRRRNRPLRPPRRTRRWRDIPRRRWRRARRRRRRPLSRRRLAEELRRQDGAATGVVERDLVEVVAAPRDGRPVKAPIPRKKRLDDFALPILHVALQRPHEVRRHDAALAVVELDVDVAVAAHLDDRRRHVAPPLPVKRADARTAGKPPPPPRRRRRRQLAQRLAEGPVAR